MFDIIAIFEASISLRRFENLNTPPKILRLVLLYLVKISLIPSANLDEVTLATFGLNLKKISRSM
mgnify:CR=1 FL=1